MNLSHNIILTQDLLIFIIIIKYWYDFLFKIKLFSYICSIVDRSEI